MSSSGITTFNMTTSQIIAESLQQIGYLGADQPTPAPEDYASALITLNMMIKAWQAMGLNLWKKQDGTLFLQANQSVYDIMLGGAAATQTYNTTQMSSTGAAGAGSISVVSGTGINIGDTILVNLDSGSFFQTTVSNVSGTTVTLASNLPSQASTNNYVRNYTVQITLPKDVLECVYAYQGGSRIKITSVSDQDYLALPNITTSNGTPVQYNVQRLQDRVRLQFWPIPIQTLDTINFKYTSIIQDFNAATDTPDLPQEWLLALTTNLAVYLAPKFGKDKKVPDIVVQLATGSLQNVMEWDNEHAPTRIEPGLW